VFPETKHSVNRATQVGIHDLELLDVSLAIRPLAMNRSQPNPLGAGIEVADPNATLNSGNVNKHEKAQLTKEIIRHNVLQ
jgi:hypothetical protein